MSSRSLHHIANKLHEGEIPDNNVIAHTDSVLTDYQGAMIFKNM